MKIYSKLINFNKHFIHLIDLEKVYTFGEFEAERSWTNCFMQLRRQSLCCSTFCTKAENPLVIKLPILN